MQSAQYGRMQYGRCINRNYNIGCQADVLPFVERKCSGRRSCAIPIPDTELHQKQPCPKDLLAYMEADFVCQKGILSIYNIAHLGVLSALPS